MFVSPIFEVERCKDENKGFKYLTRDQSRVESSTVLEIKVRCGRNYIQAESNTSRKL